MIFVGSGVAGVMMLALGLPIGLISVVLSALINGLALEISGLAWTNALQTMIPPDRLGRVASIDLLGSFALMPIGFGLAGWATAALGAANVCLLGGLLTAAYALAGFAQQAVRRLD